MRYLNLFTAISILVVVASVIFSITTVYEKKTPTPMVYSPQFDSLQMVLKQMQEHSIDSPGDTISKREYSFQIDELQNKLNEYQLETEQDRITVSASDKGFSTETFWMKVIFSSIFCLAALYVILSQKYDNETKKWAFSVLTLIAGVWIGTIT